MSVITFIRSFIGLYAYIRFPSQNLDNCLLLVSFCNPMLKLVTNLPTFLRHRAVMIIYQPKESKNSYVKTIQHIQADNLC